MNQISVGHKWLHNHGIALLFMTLPLYLIIFQDYDTVQKSSALQFEEVLWWLFEGLNDGLTPKERDRD